MNCSRRSVVRFLGVATAAALVLFNASCASSEGGSSSGSSSSASSKGPVGPTVKVVFESQPAAVIIINNTDLGQTPVTAHLEVDAAGYLMYNVKVDWNFEKAMGTRGAPSTKSLTWRPGKLPVAKVMYVGGNLTESMEKAPASPAGTKPSAERYD